MKGVREESEGSEGGREVKEDIAKCTAVSLKSYIMDTM